MSVLHLRRNSPYRPGNWRWERARLLREDPRIANKFKEDSDEYIVRARHFQEAYYRCDDDYGIACLAEKWPALWGAREIDFHSEEHVKFELQARLLANTPFEIISEKLRVSVEVIIWYEKMFFNVLDRLENQGYIIHRVLGPTFHHGQSAQDLDLLWKLYGYFGGDVVLDAVLCKTFDNVKPEKAEHMMSFGGDDIAKTMLVKGMIAARTMPINSYTQQIILEIHQKFLELKKTASGSGGLDMIAANIQETFGNLGWAVGVRPAFVSARNPDQIVRPISPEMINIDNCAVELRASELFHYDTGQGSDRIRQIAHMKFPEKSHAEDTVQSE